MHELSIALGIVDIVSEEAERRAVRVSAVHVRVGPLAGVVSGPLVSAYEMACAGSALEGSRLVVEEMPIRIYCALCQANGDAVSAQEMCCRACGTPASEVVGGQELEIRALEICE